MITIHSFTFGPFQENSYILFDETKECIIIDPGCYDDQERDELADFILTRNLKPVKLINTHCHVDHVFGNAFVAKKYNLALEIHRIEIATLAMFLPTAKMYGLDAEESPEPTVFWDEGDQIKFGSSTLKILFTPGHAPGHVVFYNEEQKFIIAGDVLFNGSIGRTDLPGGDYDTLINSIKNKLFPLGDDYVVYNGHGPETQIGKERATNPFLQ
jgi:glyoxylase-like metal-dependent hydrolase (beta-lactamase superfamily II)